jgi:hypothetical protein
MILRWYQAMRRWENRNAQGFGGSFALGLFGFLIPLCISLAVVFFLKSLSIVINSPVVFFLVVFWPPFAAMIYFILNDPKE